VVLTAEHLFEGREVARRLPAADPPGPFLLHPGEESDEEEFVERGVGSVEHRPEQRIEFVEEMLPGHARAQVGIAEAVDRGSHRLNSAEFSSGWRMTKACRCAVRAKTLMATFVLSFFSPGSVTTISEAATESTATSFSSAQARTPSRISSVSVLI